MSTAAVWIQKFILNFSYFVTDICWVYLFTAVIMLFLWDLFTHFSYDVVQTFVAIIYSFQTLYWYLLGLFIHFTEVVFVLTLVGFISVVILYWWLLGLFIHSNHYILIFGLFIYFSPDVVWIVETWLEPPATVRSPVVFLCLQLQVALSSWSLLLWFLLSFFRNLSTEKLPRHSMTCLRWVCSLQRMWLQVLAHSNTYLFAQIIHRMFKLFHI